MERGEWRVESGEWRAIPPSALRLPPSAFTLVELLVTISIMAIMAALAMGALHSARQTAAAATTKATIAKINTIIMQQYEGYLTRRVPLGQFIDSSTGRPVPATQAAQIRLYALRDLMRMEMPDRLFDITDPPLSQKVGGGTTTVSVAQPALNRLYNSRVKDTNGNTVFPSDPNAPETRTCST